MHDPLAAGPPAADGDAATLMGTGGACFNFAQSSFLMPDTFVPTRISKEQMVPGQVDTYSFGHEWTSPTRLANGVEVVSGRAGRAAPQACCFNPLAAAPPRQASEFPGSSVLAGWRAGYTRLSNNTMTGPLNCSWSTRQEAVICPCCGAHTHAPPPAGICV